MNKIVGQRNESAFHRDGLEFARELRDKISGEVRFDLGSRALYAADASNYRDLPIGVVIPRHVEDVTMKWSI